MPNLTYALDTHWPWKEEDVVVEGTLRFVDGAISVPSAPGLGVELDDDALGRLHEQYLACGITERSDTLYMQSVHSDFSAGLPRW